MVKTSAALAKPPTPAVTWKRTQRASTGAKLTNWRLAPAGQLPPATTLVKLAPSWLTERSKAVTVPLPPPGRGR